MKFHRLHLKNSLEELSFFREEAEKFIGNSLNSKNKMRVILSLDEILSNIIEHGFPDRTESFIEAEMTLYPDRIICVFTDEGIPFNPLSAPEVNINEHLDRGEDGGMGIHIVRKIMKASYEFTSDKKNRLTLIKELKGEDNENV